MLADVYLHLADGRRVAKVLIPCRFALNRVHRSLDLENLSPRWLSNLLRYQQASGLDFIDVQMQKIRYIRAFRENPTQFRHEQKCCGMTNFDGIRGQEWPSSIIFSFRKVFTAGMIPGNGSE